MLFFYLRHADPIYNHYSLTPQGLLQADALAKRLALYGIDRIFASSSNRAQMTARPTADLVNKNVEIVDFANEGHAWRELTVKRDEVSMTWLFQHTPTVELFHSPEIMRLG